MSKSDLLDKQKEEVTTKPPPMWKVVFINDDFTSFDVVIAILQMFFGKTYDEASAFAQQVHESGKGIAGVYTYDIANTKQRLSEEFAKSMESPLMIQLESS
jgi:ATP-dependent Clp protease adaptor protein ClpS